MTELDLTLEKAYKDGAFKTDKDGNVLEKPYFARSLSLHLQKKGYRLVEGYEVNELVLLAKPI